VISYQNCIFAYIDKQTIPFDKGPKRPVPFELLRLYKLLCIKCFSSISSFARLRSTSSGFSPFGKEINAP
jgi:hypothetical protein